MKNIRIGDEWVEVELGYLKAESEYTRVESKIFGLAESGPAKEYARARALEKRVEFYQHVKDGTIVIPKPELKKDGRITQWWKHLTS